MIYRALIADDEPLARARIRRFLAGEKDFRAAWECGNGKEAIQIMAHEKPDLVFLDIQMPAADAFEVLEKIPRNSMPVVIFVTAFDEHALRAFQNHALDYLLKPVTAARFQQAMEKARTYLRGKDAHPLPARLDGLLADLGCAPERLALKSDGRTILLAPAEIDWVEAVGNYVNLHAGRATHLVRMSLTEMERKLPSATFVRIHRSRLVQLAAIREIHPLFNRDARVILKSGAALEASRAGAALLQARLAVRP